MHRDCIWIIAEARSSMAFSASTPVDSSSLSDAPSEQQNESAGHLAATPANGKHFFGENAQDQEQAGSGIAPDPAHAISAEDESSDGEAELPFKCQHCDKAYSTERNLKVRKALFSPTAQRAEYVW